MDQAPKNLRNAVALAYDAGYKAPTVVASGNVRSLVYSSDSTTANSYVYKMYVSDLQNASPSANAMAATANTIQLPSYFSQVNNAYAGVGISINKGTDAGDFRTIVSYNGTTRTATLNQNWTVTPDTTSVFSLNFAIKDVETIVTAGKSSYPATINGFANINTASRANTVATGDTVLINPIVSVLFFCVHFQLYKLQMYIENQTPFKYLQLCI